MSGNRYLVLGATGFIGSHLCRALASRGDSFVAVDSLINSSINRYNHLVAPHANTSVIESDLTEYLARPALPDFSHVIDLAYINGTRLFYKFGADILRSAVTNADAASDFAKSVGAHYMYAGTPEAYGHPDVFPTPEDAKLCVPDVRNPRWSYSIGKIAAENLLFCKRSASEWDGFTIFRPNNAYGPFDRRHAIPELTKKLLSSASELEVLGHPTDTRSFCFIDDMVQMILMLSDEKPRAEIYNVGSGIETTIHDLVLTLMSVYETEKRVRWIEPLKGNPSRRLPSVSKLETLFKEKYTTLDQGLQLTRQAEQEFSGDW